jgi:hypothetical protein
MPKNKFVSLAIIILVILWVVNNPAEASADVKHFTAGVAAFVHGI